LAASTTTQLVLVLNSILKTFSYHCCNRWRNLSCPADEMKKQDDSELICEKIGKKYSFTSPIQCIVNVSATNLSVIDLRYDAEGMVFTSGWGLYVGALADPVSLLSRQPCKDVGVWIKSFGPTNYVEGLPLKQLGGQGSLFVRAGILVLKYLRTGRGK
jgi:hypothetical protein